MAAMIVIKCLPNPKAYLDISPASRKVSKVIADTCLPASSSAAFSRFGRECSPLRLELSFAVDSSFPQKFNIVRQEQQQADNMVVIATLLLLLCLNINQATAASATRFPDIKSSTTPSPTKSASTGTTASCQAALRECALFSVDEASLDNVYQQAFSAMLQKQRLEYQHNLVKARDFLINLMNLFILNPDLPPDSRSCQGADSTPVTILNDPTATLPKVDSVPDITVRKLEQCVVNEWSSWSNPFAFGVIERRRTVVQKGVCCPDDLVQQVNVSAYIGSTDTVFQNKDNVGEYFHNDFLNKQPRDILLIIDTSSSIFSEDFEY
ncbi:hypothetical protein C0Q70_11415 [Pomacea canaliculata]|uniref:Uncharacterized protein n=1 Tax=Pomacea canaliculata TaxID=400727 RepID=A0A2T7P5X6_POMCA|nr:hypothetical protein C0Q70_11415 [Pomacea canaliculata]